jgi:hypothetical protein
VLDSTDLDLEVSPPPNPTSPPTYDWTLPTRYALGITQGFRQLRREVLPLHRKIQRILNITATARYTDRLGDISLDFLKDHNFTGPFKVIIPNGVTTIEVLALMRLTRSAPKCKFQVLIEGPKGGHTASAFLNRLVVAVNKRAWKTFAETMTESPTVVMSKTPTLSIVVRPEARQRWMPCPEKCQGDAEKVLAMGWITSIGLGDMKLTVEQLDVRVGPAGPPRNMMSQYGNAADLGRCYD